MLDTHILDTRYNLPPERGGQGTQLKLQASSSLKLRRVCKNKVNYLQHLLSSTQILYYLHVFSQLLLNLKVCFV